MLFRNVASRGGDFYRSFFTFKEEALVGKDVNEFVEVVVVQDF